MKRLTPKLILLLTAWLAANAWVWPTLAGALARNPINEWWGLPYILTAILIAASGIALLARREL